MDPETVRTITTSAITAVSTLAGPAIVAYFGYRRSQLKQQQPCDKLAGESADQPLRNCVKRSGILMSTKNICNGISRSYKTNMPIAAANIAIVVITTTTRDSIELGWPCINLRSQATKRMPTRRKGASRPLMTAVQKRALTGLIFKKSIAIPTRVEKMSTV